ncbi:XRE family transcriptional regulator [Brachybacterium muris]|uniref:ImmA/IrrE family metallo-endopeptidase n=1 Tax=Brachybacterium muris TaxID=219301 RepID=UPI0021A4A421|nr:XRE family transcriptional regulator [Brachybacterium muris]MCT1997060.1 XRE family transcriptional regulator [Brachybacterium muris]
MNPSIGERVLGALPVGTPQKEIARQVGMTEDAFSRALRGQRGFSALELARLAEVLDQDIHLLITGEPDPNRLVVSGRHNFDRETWARSIDGEQGDKAILSDVLLAYRQSETVRPLEPSRIPRDLPQAREALGPGFVPEFIDRLAALEIDTVRLSGLSTAYSLHVGARAVMVIPETGNWFKENFDLAHELAHLVLGHEGVLASIEREVSREEAAANSFAAELLLPEEEMRAQEWATVSPQDLAALIWSWGVSTHAVKVRLNSLRIRVSPHTQSLLDLTTQGLLRRYWKHDGLGDPITERMTLASARRFPAWLTETHVEGVAQGRIQKGTLAWMLGVDPETLEVEEPPAPTMSDSDLMSLLG